MEYSEHWVPRGTHRIYAREYPGEGPPIVLMHGFPDNLHLYDRLVPHLAGRRVVVFDFLGWGHSDKPKGYPYSADNQARDLDAVIGYLGLEDVVLVAHDASGPPAIDWALWHPERTATLVLLNTYYGRTSAAHPPEAIFLFSTPGLRNIARFVSGRDRKSTRLNSSHANTSYAVFCLKKKTKNSQASPLTSRARRGRTPTSAASGRTRRRISYSGYAPRRSTSSLSSVSS